MSIAILTYDTPHLKTAQVFNILRNRGIDDVDFMIMPFVQRPIREVLFSHRPNQFAGVGARELAARYGRAVHPYGEWQNLIDSYDQFIVCGSNLIDREFANSGRILNCHSGLIPAVRGLDSFKWAILHKKPIGNTLHQLDEFADAGVVLAHVRTPVYAEDTLSTFAARHYENEIWMLGYYDWVIENGRTEELELSEPTKRMPMSVEQEMVDSFEAYKTVFCR
jgi:phosphoribosylglycinamide formyltransferase-1